MNLFRFFRPKRTILAGLTEDDFKSNDKLIRVDPTTRAFISGNKEEFDENYIQKDNGNWEHKN